MRKLWLFVVLIVAFLFIAMPLFADDCRDHGGKWECVEQGEEVVKSAYLRGMQDQITALQAENDALQFNLEATWLDLETTELQLEMIKSDLEISQSNLEAAENSLLAMQQEFDEKDVEIIVLEDKLALSDKRYAEDTKGVWLGATTGYPFGLLGTVNYQFSDRYMANGGIGYMGGFQIQVGFATKIW